MKSRRSMSLPAVLAAVGAPVGSGLVARAAGWPWWLVLGAVVVALAVVILTQRRELFTPFMEKVVEPEITRPHDEAKRTRYMVLLWLAVGASLIAVVLGAGQWGWAAFTLSLGGALVYHGSKVHVPRGRGRAAASIAVGGFLVSLSANFIAGALAGETALDKSVANIDTNVRALLGLTKKIDETTTRTEGKVDKSNEQLALILKYLESQKQPGVDPSSVPVPPEVLAAAHALMKSKDAHDRAQAAIVLKQWDAAKREIDAFNASPAEDEVFRNKTIEGRFYFAQRRFDDAVPPYEIAFALRPDELDARNNLAIALQSCKIGDISAKRLRAIDIHKSSLARPDIARTHWALIQNNLSAALNDQALASESAERARLLGEAVAACREALTVRTRDALPQEWAMTQINLGKALHSQAMACEGAERARLFVEAVTAFRETLTVYSRNSLPQEWALTQNNLGAALTYQASASEGAERARLLGEAVAACCEALTVRTRDTLPYDWAMTQSNLGNVLSDQALASESAERARLLGEAVAACREALTVRTRDALPYDWAETQSGLGIALGNQALANEGAERARLLGEAVEAFRGTLTVCTRDTLPYAWAMTQSNLGFALASEALASEDTERSQLLRSSIAACKGALAILTHEHFPVGHEMALENLKIARDLYESSGCSSGPDGVPFDDIPPAE
ncbi:MAG: hypothetical protein IT434_02045 [Phycisphaerales bacterium]|jgi:tetratricopeptide (TPR) repeat protein|nr:hypothetical protein [Phycisphaerales bacterium]